MAREQEIRDYLHTIPETGFNEHRTAAFLADALTQAGYRVTTGLGGKTGVVGVLDSGIPGPVMGIRADIDALGHIIDGKPAALHSCGHDGHMAMALAAAETIIRDGLVKRGRLKIIFQPAEEIGLGAYSILESGVLDDVDYLIGQHVRPIEEAKNGQASPAMYYSACGTWEVDITGLRSHAARPHLGHNALDAAAAAIAAVNAIHCDPRRSFSIKATRCLCDAGATNAIPDHAHLSFDLRAEDNDIMQQLQERSQTAITQAVAAYGCTADLTMTKFLPAAEYPEDMIALLADCIREVLGDDGLLPPLSTPGGEDFCHYVKAKPNLKVGFFGLGCNLKPGLHAPDMTFDPAALTNGKNILLAAVKKILG